MGSDCPDYVSGRSGEMGVSGGLGKRVVFGQFGGKLPSGRSVKREVLGWSGVMVVVSGKKMYKVGHQFPPTVVVLCKLLRLWDSVSSLIIHNLIKIALA